VQLGEGAVVGKLGAFLVAALVFVGCSGGNAVGDTGNGNTGGGSSDGGVVSQDPGDGGVVTQNPGDGGTSTAPPGLTPGSLGKGPWPTGNVTYGAADGIRETPIVGISTDESQNLYVATGAALYVRTAQASSFTRFASADGLHLPGHDMDHCYDPAGGNNGLLQPCPSSDADSAGISEIVGGGPNEVLVGYWGHEDFNLGNLPDGTPIDGTSSDPWRHTGKVDRVRLRLDSAGNPAGIDVVKLDVLSTNSNEFWHNRTVERMIYDHFTHPHELYVGFNHGVDKLTPDLWAEPDPKTWFLNSYAAWMSDHLHPQVCLHATCTGEGSDTQMLGDWRGLAIDAKGDLWVGGRWAAGKIGYVRSNADWYNNPRADKSHAISPAFGDGYNSSLCGTSTAPVFCPPQEGDPVNISATAVTPDGKIWWGSGTLFGDPADVPYGLASFDGRRFTYFTPASVGLSEDTVRDLIALPDGRLVIASLNTGLVIWNPTSGQHTAIRAGQGIPSDRIYRMELDTMVSPPVLHVATASGAASIRAFPQ
jgi:hypothetical protein